MMTIKNDQSMPVNIGQIEADAKKIVSALGYADYDLTVCLVTNQAMQQYNKKYREKNAPTDILSFPFWPELKAGEKINPTHEDEKALGDIIIAPEYVQTDLPKWDQTFDQRMRTLLVHGICHLLGYDHIQDEDYEIMRAKEEELLSLLQ